MRIVVLDGFTANPGDLEWKRLEALGDLTVYPRTSEEEIVERAEGAEIVYTNKTPLSAHTLSRLKDLKFIGVLATGYNVVDIVEATRLGITVCNVPAYSTMSVAQNVFALILDFTNSVAHYSREVRDGKWSECEDFSFTDTSLVELAGKQMGIIGYGAIGQQVGKIASAFGMDLAVYTSKCEEKIAPARKMEIDEIFKLSDIISLHCPLTDTTFHLANKERIDMMKPSAILINTGRGPLVDEGALAEALNAGKIAGAGVDVLSQEPPSKDNPLLTAKNIRITPHISWATQEARKRLIDISVRNLEAFLTGKPQNVVN